ncbi:hypothetical protein BGZ65_010534, partial [Modicella reniformis]
MATFVTIGLRAHDMFPFSRRKRKLVVRYQAFDDFSGYDTKLQQQDQQQALARLAPKAGSKISKSKSKKEG